MSAAPKTTRDAVAEEFAKTTEIRDNFAALYSKGVERLAEMQKRSIDLALQHSQETIGLWKQMADSLPWTPRLPVFNQAAGNLERLADTQKTMIDLVTQQTHAAAEMMKERAAAAKKTSESVVAFAQESFDRSVAAQKKAAETTMHHTKATLENAREHFGFPGSEAVAESIQRGVDSIVEAQKAVLETVAS